MRLCSVLLITGTTACSSVTVEERVACEGRITSSPTVLQSEIPEEGVLRVAGGQLIVTTKTAVQRVDACSGALEPLAELDHIQAVAYYAEHLYLRHTDIMQFFGWLSRVPIAGGEIERVGDLGTSAGGLVASQEGVYSMLSDPASEKDRMLVEVTTGTATPLVRLETQDGVKQYSLVGTSDRGVYLRSDYDSGFPIGLSRWPHEGDQLLDVEGTPAVRSMSVVNDEMAVLREPDRYQEIAFVPTTGGEGRVVVSSDELPQGYGVTSVAAAIDTVCWSTYDAGPSCKRLSTSETAAIDTVEANSLVMLGDVLYWIRAHSELMAVLP